MKKTGESAAERTGMDKQRRHPKLIAFYLPQYHPIPENDSAWGKGFTEWTNVTKAKALFPGHYQPHIPADLGFYDLRLAETREAQAELARQYGVYGFCYYHYWFNGKRPLGRPLQEVLASGKPDFPFCLCWANEKWTRNWDGRSSEVLIDQHYSKEDDLNHIRWLCGVFGDDRYIRVNGKPLLLVYRVSDLPDPLGTTSLWRKEAQRLGLPGLYLCRVEAFGGELSRPETLGFDASVEFQPDWTGLRPVANLLTDGNWVSSYRDAVELVCRKEIPPFKRFPCVTPSWDNTARKSTDAFIFLGATPSLYGKWLGHEIDTLEERNLDDDIVFINAWNEWGEGNHLEPDLKFGRAWLEATLDAIRAALPTGAEGAVRQAPPEGKYVEDEAAACLFLGSALKGSDAKAAGRYLDQSLRLTIKAMARNFHNGRALKFASGPESAKRDHAKILSGNSSRNSWVLDLTGMNYALLGDKLKALFCLRHAAAADGGNIAARKNLARLLQASGREKEAMQTYEEILSVSPRDADALLALGGLRLDKGQGARAESLFGRALEAEPAKQGQKREIPVVSIIIPVFNKVEYTRKCIEAIRRNTPCDLCEIIIIDNASTDGTKDYLKGLNEKMRVNVISNDANLGFTKACNQGAAAAGGRYIVFLNNDTEPQPKWLEYLVETIESDAEAGIAGPKFTYPDGRLQEAGGIIFNDGSGWNFGRGDDPSRPIYNYVKEIDYVSGACLLIRRSLLQQLNYFDERYSPGYYEDTDLCFGARSAGYKVVYCPLSLVIHHEGATSGTDLSAGMKKFQDINKEKFVIKWSGALKNQYPAGSGNVIPGSERQIEGNILIIDKYLPWFDRASGSLRLLSIIRLLKKQNYHITYIAREGRDQERYIRVLQRLGVEVYATDPQKLDRSGISGIESIDLKRILSDRFYETAFLSFYDVALQYLPEIRACSPGTKILIDTVDIHFVREQRMAELNSDKALLKKAEATKKDELYIYGKADAIITITDRDWDHIRDYLPGARHFVIPNIHCVDEGPIESDGRSGLIFVGNFNHLPNVDAVKYFLGEIFPKIKAKIPDMTFTIVGPLPPKEIASLQNKDIIVAGYVPETGPYLKRARISIAPLRYGAGMKGKIGEAMAHGVPVVTTSIGAEGIGLISGETALIADSADGFAECVVGLYSDDGLWRRIAINSREFIARHYSLEKIGMELADMLRSMQAEKASFQAVASGAGGEAVS